MKTVKIDEIVHIVTYQCNTQTLCNKHIPENSFFTEKKSVWEATCYKCKKYFLPGADFIKQ